MALFKQFGTPIYNLWIHTRLEPTTFTTEDLSLLPHYGRIVKFVRLHIQGQRYITDKGYLLPKFVPGDMRPVFPSLEEKTAKLDIIENCWNVPQLEIIVNRNFFRRIFKPNEKNPYGTGVRLEFDDGTEHFLKAEGSHLYLSSEHH